MLLGRIADACREFLRGLPFRLRSSKWRGVRDEHLRRERVCQWCGSRIYLEVHHVLPVHLRPDLELEPTNLITLCESPNSECHLKQGHNGNWHNFRPDIRESCDDHRINIEISARGFGI